MTHLLPNSLPQSKPNAKLIEQVRNVMRTGPSLLTVPCARERGTPSLNFNVLFLAVAPLQKRDKNLVPIMPRTGLDRNVIDQILLVDFQRLAKCHFRRCFARTGNLFLSMLSEEFR